VVQKLIETINSQEAASMIVSALSPGAVTLMMDVNGYHVAHHCLKNLSPEHKQVRVICFYSDIVWFLYCS
jgi:aspartate ammonia-lyase